METPAPTTHKIVLIDDEEIVRSSLRLILRGYSVFEAANGREGLDLCSTRTPDLVITDLMMPGIDGEELIAELTKRTPAPKIIAISANADALTMAARLGANAVLAKPFGARELLQSVEQLLTRITP